jgi:hypothetical protein
MRSRVRDAPAGAGAEHGVANGLVGIGEALAATPATLEEAVAAAGERLGAKDCAQHSGARQDALMHRKQDSRRRLLLAAGCMLGLALATSAPSAGQVVRPCKDQRCEARVRVPLDRSGVVAGTIDLSVRVKDRSSLPNTGSGDGHAARIARRRGADS